MAVLVNTFEVTTTPQIVPLGKIYNNVEGEIHVPSGGGSVFIGGPDVDNADHGYELDADSKTKITLTSGEQLWARSSTGTVEIKFIVTGA